MKITSTSVIHTALYLVIYCYLGRTNDKVLEFQMNIYSYFEISAPFFKVPPSNKGRIFTLQVMVLIRGNAVT